MTLQAIGTSLMRAIATWFAPAGPSTQPAIALPPILARVTAPAIPVYFMEPSWARRREAFIDALPQSMGGGFASANAQRIRTYLLARGQHASMHVVFNLGAAALLDYLHTGIYKNAYDGPTVNGKRRTASPTRERVDTMLGLAAPANTYFCALAMGGAGIRFYGEYCAVLKSRDDELSVKRVMDRNSYDLICPPIKRFLRGLNGPGKRLLIDGMSAQFRTPECADMLAIKVMQTENGHARLLTAATIGAAVICDEDYAEAYHEGKIALETVLELRERSDEKMTEADIKGRLSSGGVFTLEELLWQARRDSVRVAAAAAGIAIRTVNGSGRTQRWK